MPLLPISFSAASRNTLIESESIPLYVHQPFPNITHHVTNFHSRCHRHPALQVGLHRRSLGIPAGVIQPAHPLMDGQLPYVNIYQAVSESPVDLLGLWLYPVKLLQEPLGTAIRSSKSILGVAARGVRPKRRRKPNA